MAHFICYFPSINASFIFKTYVIYKCEPFKYKYYFHITIVMLCLFFKKKNTRTSTLRRDEGTNVLLGIISNESRQKNRWHDSSLFIIPCVLIILI